MNRAYGMFHQAVGQCESELLGGAIHIRSMQTQESALRIHAEFQNYNTLAEMVVMGGYQYFSLIAKQGSMFLTLAAALYVIYGKTKTEVDPIMSLMLFQRVQGLGHTLTGMLHSFTEKSNEIFKVQKVFKLLDINHENKSQPRHEDPSWPQKGALEIKDVQMRYRPTTDIVLKGMNVSIKGGEKVGIAGRTGAGKSTLAISLTRIVDIFAGNILLDGVDINKISLQQVREVITIIPQDPVLF